MSQKSDSEESRKSAEKIPKDEGHKIFVTGLDGKARRQNLQDELRKAFAQYGKIDKLVVKRSIRSDYCFAFVDFERGADGASAIKNLDGVEICGRKMKVQQQDDSRRRKERPDGCFICGRLGHYARDCHDKDNDRGRDRDDRRSRSRSRSGSKRRRHRSRSRKSKSKKQRRKRSRSRSNHRRKDKRDRRSSRSQS